MRARDCAQGVYGLSQSLRPESQKAAAALQLIDTYLGTTDRPPGDRQTRRINKLLHDAHCMGAPAHRLMMSALAPMTNAEQRRGGYLRHITALEAALSRGDHDETRAELQAARLTEPPTEVVRAIDNFLSALQALTDNDVAAFYTALAGHSGKPTSPQGQVIDTLKLRLVKEASIYAAVQARTAHALVSLYTHLDEAMQQAYRTGDHQVSASLVAAARAHLEHDVGNKGSVAALMAWTPQGAQQTALTLGKLAVEAASRVGQDEFLAMLTAKGFTAFSEPRMHWQQGGNTDFIEQVNDMNWQIHASVHSHGQCGYVYEEQPVEAEVCVYQLSSCPTPSVLTHLETLAEGNFDVVSMGVHQNGRSTTFLVRAGAARVRDLRLLRTPDLDDALTGLQARPYKVCAYTAATPEGMALGQACEHWLLVAYGEANTYGYHVVRDVSRSALESTIAEQRRVGREVCGVTTSSTKNAAAPATFTVLSRQCNPAAPVTCQQPQAPRQLSVNSLQMSPAKGRRLGGLNIFGATKPPPQIRGCIESPIQQRAQTMAKLSKSGVDAATWAANLAVRDMFLVRPHKVAQPGRFYYEYHCAPVAKERKLVAILGRAGLDIVGMYAPGQAGAPSTMVQVMARRDLGCRGPRPYGVFRTRLLAERLNYLTSAGFEVCAYNRRIAGDNGVDHVLIAREAPGHIMQHQVETLALGKNLSLHIDALVNSRAEDGWCTAGLDVAHSAATLIFKRPAPPDLHQSEPPALPGYHNATTLMGEPIGLVPELLRFCSQDGYAFDIEELTDAILEKGAKINPWTGALFGDEDLAAMAAHASGAYERLSILPT